MKKPIDELDELFRRTPRTLWEKLGEFLAQCGALALVVLLIVSLVSIMHDVMNDQLDCRICRFIVANGQPR